MIKKLWVVTASNIWLTIVFVLVSWALVGTYHLGEWEWFTFFMIILPFYIFKLAHISAFYDIVKRRGDL